MELKLSDSQQCVFDSFGACVRYGLVCGEPGTGKSAVTRAINDHFLGEGFKVLVVTIANMALRGYPEDQRANFAQFRNALSKPKRPSQHRHIAAFMRAVKKGERTLLIIDEVFLMNAGNISELDTLLCKYRVGSSVSSQSLLFGGITNVLFVGDKGQLKPVNGNPAGTWDKMHRFHVYHLTENYRQKDALFADMIKQTSAYLQDPSSAEGPPLEFLDYIRNAMRSESPNEAAIVGWRRKDLNKALESGQNGNITLVPSGLSTNASDREKEMSVIRRGQEVRLKVNARFCETGTQFTPNGTFVCNGSTVTFIDAVPAIEGKCLMLDDTQITVKIGDEMLSLEPHSPYSKSMGRKPPKGYVVPIEGLDATTVSLQGTTVHGKLHFTASEVLNVPAEHVLLAVGRVTRPEDFTMSSNVRIRWPPRRAPKRTSEDDEPTTKVSRVE